jgi:large-conductance mechanosensitive channel
MLSDPDIKKFIMKYTVIASSLTWLLGSQVRVLSEKCVEALVDPLFSIDLDSNGEPDLKQLDRFIVESLGFKFPIGKIILEVIRTFVTLIFLYCVIKLFMKYTTLLDKL